MAPAFTKDEYDERLFRIRQSMRDRNLDALIIGDPSNINWLTGYDAWSFYTPQMMLVGLDKGPFWMGREMDAGAAHFTTYLSLVSCSRSLSRSNGNACFTAIAGCGYFRCDHSSW